ncbi:hypothetical protein M9H77_13534 [Catharanthus roseus]|uniref:Uncharacterized protein n=1 Tax=Catharanthus roseus TaxID=4058 RepID=A0ACC0BKM3_CATRO|nr:hypothetical protein M9H77_13534 [Catharanthus roseus]
MFFFSEQLQNIAIFGMISLSVFLETFSTMCYVFPRKKMHRSGAPYKYKWPFCLQIHMKKKPHSDQGVNSGYDLVFGSVRGLHYTWLVPRTRASSDGLDDSDLGEWIHLKRGVDRGECGSIGLRGHRIMLYGEIRLPSGESGGA